jgi:uncharacterized protein (TIGR03435 family)
MGRPEPETSIARSGERGKGFENLAPQGGKGFEKPHSRGGKGFEKVVRKGSLGFENRHRSLLRYAYRVRDYQLIDPPNWGASVPFDVEATYPGDSTPSNGQVRAMLRRLLAERFGLVAHEEIRPRDVSPENVGSRNKSRMTASRLTRRG